MAGTLYKDTPLEELTKEELIKVIEELSEFFRRQQEAHLKDFDMLCGVG